jgi:hypothetical protein
MTDLFPITRADKLAEVRREIAMREAVYPRRVQRGAMMPEQAQRQIAVMRAIAQDYEGNGP